MKRTLSLGAGRDGPSPPFMTPRQNFGNTSERSAMTLAVGLTLTASGRHHSCIINYNPAQERGWLRSGVTTGVSGRLV